MKKIIGMIILVVMVIGTAAYAEDTIKMRELGFDPAGHHHSVEVSEEYKAYLKGKEVREAISTTIGTVNEWWTNAEWAATSFIIDCGTTCANAVTGVAKDIGKTATTVWDCARGFVDGFFG